MNVGFRHPELFAAVFPAVGRVRKVPAVALEGKLDRGAPALMSDCKTSYYDHVDGPRFAAQRHDDLPFLCWACGRNDGYATWQEHIDMVKALTEGHHGFAFSWNNGGHGEGGQAMQALSKHYPASKFARGRSYPALGNVPHPAGDEEQHQEEIENNRGNRQRYVDDPGAKDDRLPVERQQREDVKTGDVDEPDDEEPRLPVEGDGDQGEEEGE